MVRLCLVKQLGYYVGGDVLLKSVSAQQGYLSLSMLGKNFSRRHFEIFFPPKIGFGIACKLSPKGDNLHEMPNPIFWGKIREMVSVYHLLNLLIAC